MSSALKRFFYDDALYKSILSIYLSIYLTRRAREKIYIQHNWTTVQNLTMPSCKIRVYLHQTETECCAVINSTQLTVFASQVQRLFAVLITSTRNNYLQYQTERLTQLFHRSYPHLAPPKTWCWSAARGIL